MCAPSISPPSPLCAKTGREPFSSPKPGVHLQNQSKNFKLFSDRAKKGRGKEPLRKNRRPSILSNAPFTLCRQGTPAHGLDVLSDKQFFRRKHRSRHHRCYPKRRDVHLHTAPAVQIYRMGVTASRPGERAAARVGPSAQVCPIAFAR